MPAGVRLPAIIAVPALRRRVEGKRGLLLLLLVRRRRVGSILPAACMHPLGTSPSYGTAATCRGFTGADRPAGGADLT